MAINLVTKFEKYVDELFAKDSKRSLVTNNDFDWTGAHTVKIYKVGTAQMNDYNRSGADLQPGESRYGTVETLDATTEEMTLKKDRSFTFTIDKLDRDETGDALNAADALNRQSRQVVIPEIDSYTYGVMAAGAGTKPDAKELTAENIYDEITTGTEIMDDEMVPETGRVLVVVPAVYRLLKKCPDIHLDCDISEDQRRKGVIAMVDGMDVVKVPAIRLPANFGFMIAHPIATVAPVKLEDYKAHEDPPGISGSLCEGRFVYDAFVLENKTKAIYYQAMAAATANDSGSGDDSGDDDQEQGA